MNYYDLLQIQKTASYDEIRKAYIKQSLVWHPDRNTDPAAKDKFQQMAQAYYVLSDPLRRKEYDISETFKTDKVDPISVFTSVFDDLLIPEVENPIWFYQPLGALAGIFLGFILLNIPGAVIGYYFGSKMGKVRDMKGTCVYDAFQKLPIEKRTSILTDLAKKMFKNAIEFSAK